MGGMSSKKAQIIIVGLDNSGKSTMINILKPSKYAQVEIAATIGFKVETFKHSKINFTCFDMSGQGKYRSLWEKYYAECEVSFTPRYLSMSLTCVTIGDNLCCGCS